MWLVPLAVFALSLGLNLVRLDATTLWNDEAESVLVAWDGIRTATKILLDSNLPPLYFLTLSFWISAGGASVFWVRMLSALAVAVATGLVCASARQMFGWRIGLMAGVLFAIAPMDVDLAQKARPYPFQIVVCAITFWGLIQVLADTLEAGRRPRGDVIGSAGSRRGTLHAALGWSAYVVGSAATVLVQPTGGFFLLVLNVGMIIAVAASDLLRRRWIMRWLAAQILVSTHLVAPVTGLCATDRAPV